MNHTYLPDTKDLHKNVAGEARSKHLRNDENVGGQSALQHDGHVGGIKQLDRVGPTLTTEPVALDGDFNTEALEVNNDGEDDNSREEGHDIRKTLSPESLAEGAPLVVPCEEKMEKSDDGTLKLTTATDIDGSGGEGLPDNTFTDVGGDKQVNTTSKSIAFLEEFVKEDDDKGRDNELNDEQETDTSTKILGLSVKSSENVNGCLTKGDNESKYWSQVSIRHTV